MTEFFKQNPSVDKRSLGATDFINFQNQRFDFINYKEWQRISATPSASMLFPSTFAPSHHDRADHSSHDA